MDVRLDDAEESWMFECWMLRKVGRGEVPGVVIVVRVVA